MISADLFRTAGMCFDTRNHRCLFQNECLQAHLLGLKAGCPCVDGCFPAGATLIVTYGEACARVQGRLSQLHAGDRLELPPSGSFHLATETEADVMLLVPSVRGAASAQG